jgi:WD40 repeat protein/serine/threonine protein kinase
MDKYKNPHIEIKSEAETLLESKTDNKEIIEKRKISETLWSKGQVIDNLYRVEHVLQGGMGIIYFIEHLKWGIKLVVKSPLSDFSKEEHKKRFIREAETWVDLGKHPNIATAYYVRDLHGVPGIFIEYADGGSLADYLKKDNMRSLPEILDIAIQFSEGIRYAHKKGLVHRDIKPDNILLMKDRTVKITDFGLVKTKDKIDMGALKNIECPSEISQDEWHTMTHGYVMGTPPYMAPEQWTEADRADKRADIYSFGIMLFEMICGRRPFVKDQKSEEHPLLAYQMMHRFSQPPDPEEYRKDMPVKLKNLLLKCLKKNPHERYNLFEEILDELLMIYSELTGKDYPGKMPGEAQLKSEDLNNRGLSYLDLGKKEEAIKLFEEAIRLDPHSIYANINLIILLSEVNLDSYENILLRFKTVREGNTGNPLPFYYEAIYELEYGNTQKSLSLISQALELEKLNAMFWNIKGVSLFNLMKYREASEAFKISLEIDKENKEAMRNYASSLYNLRKYRESCDEFSKALDMYEDDIDLKTDLSVALSGTGEFKKSLSTLDEVLRKDRDSIKGNLYKGELLAGINTYIPTFKPSETMEKDSEGYLKKALTLAPHVPRVMESYRDYTIKFSLPSPTLPYYKPADKIKEKEKPLLMIEPGDIKTFEGSGGKIKKVCFLTDSQVLSINTDSLIELWDSNSEKSIKKFYEDSSYMKFEAFDITVSPCKKYIISAHGDGKIRKWNIEKGEIADTFTGEAIIRSVDISSDGKLIVSAGNDGIVGLWESETGVCIKNINNGGGIIFCARFSPDGTYIATGNQNKTIKLWNRQTGQLYKTMSGHQGAVITLSFSHDGKYILSGSEDKSVKIWDIESSSSIMTFMGHNSQIETVDFSPSGLYCISGSGDGIIKIWDIEKEICARTLSLHRFAVTGIKFSPHGSSIVTGSSDKTVKFIEVPVKSEKTFTAYYKKEYLIVKPKTVEETFKDEEIFQGLIEEGEKHLKEWNWHGAYDLFRKAQNIPGYGKDSLVLSSIHKAGTGGVREGIKSIWLLKSYFEEEGGGITSADIYEKDNTLLCGYKDGTVKILDKREKITAGNQEIFMVKFLKNPGEILTANDKSIKEWDINSGKCIKTIIENLDFKTVDLSYGENYIVTGGGLTDNSVKVWDMEKGEIIRNFQGHISAIGAVKISKDNTVVLSGSDDKALKLWDVNSGKCIRNFPGHVYPVTACDISPDGKTILSGSQDKTVRVWDREREKSIHILKGHEGGITKVAFSPDGLFIISAGKDSTIRLWKTETGDCLKVLQEHKDEVRDIKFSSDGRYIISSSMDGTVKIFDIDWNYSFPKDTKPFPAKAPETVFIEPKITIEHKEEFVPDSVQYFTETKTEKKLYTQLKALLFIPAVCLIILVIYMVIQMSAEKPKVQRLVKEILSQNPKDKNFTTMLFAGERTNNVKSLLKTGHTGVDVLVEDGLVDPPFIEINSYIIQGLPSKIGWFIIDDKTIEEFKKELPENENLKYLDSLKNRKFSEYDFRKNLKNLSFNDMEISIIMEYSGKIDEKKIKKLNDLTDKGFRKKDLINKLKREGFNDKEARIITDYASDDVDYIKLNAMGLLTQFDDKEYVRKKAAKEFVKLLSSKESYIRTSAAKSLAEIGSVESLNDIRKALLSEPEKWKEEYKEEGYFYNNEDDEDISFDTYKPWSWAEEEYKEAISKLEGKK